MARPLRIERVGSRYHVTSRGNERKAIFRDDFSICAAPAPKISQQLPHDAPGWKRHDPVCQPYDAHSNS